MEDKKMKELVVLSGILGLMLMDGRIPLEVRAIYAELVNAVQEEDKKNAK
jgi:hypothetical protein